MSFIIYFLPCTVTQYFLCFLISSEKKLGKDKNIINIIYYNLWKKFQNNYKNCVSICKKNFHPSHTLAFVFYSILFLKTKISCRFLSYFLSRPTQSLTASAQNRAEEKRDCQSSRRNARLFDTWWSSCLYLWCQPGWSLTLPLINLPTSLFF